MTGKIGLIVSFRMRRIISLGGRIISIMNSWIYKIWGNKYIKISIFIFDSFFNIIFFYITLFIFFF